MADTKRHLGMNKDVTCEQQVVVFGHGACQGVLDGNYRRGHRAALDAIEDFGRTGARDSSSSRQHLPGSFVAEAAELTLNGYSHGLRRA